MKDLKEAYKTIEADHFAPQMEISFIDGDRRDMARIQVRKPRFTSWSTAILFSEMLSFCRLAVISLPCPNSFSLASIPARPM